MKYMHLIIFLVFTLTNISHGFTQEMKEFESQSEKYVFSYPNDWIFKKGILLPPKDNNGKQTAFVNIRIVVAPDSVAYYPTTDSILKKLQDVALKKVAAIHEDYTVLEQSFFDITDKRCIYTIFTGENSGKKIKSKQYIVRDEDNYYLVAFIGFGEKSYERYVDQVDRIVFSIESKKDKIEEEKQELKNRKALENRVF